MGLKRHIAYGKYLFRHKWFVTIECFKRRLYWRGLVHDLSKFRPSEWFPYARYFYEPDGNPKQKRDKTGYYKPEDTGDKAFEYAWFLHQKRNKHHWQYWILPNDDGSVKCVRMDRKYIIEMVCDWTGAGLAQGHGKDLLPWYLKNKDKMQFHKITSAMVEIQVKLFTG